VLTPDEIIANGLPLILDTSHIKQEKTMDLIEKHHGGIVGIHLSEKRADEHPEHQGEINQHQPVKDFGFRVLDALILKKWNGTVALEYMPWWHHRLVPDYNRLVDYYLGGDGCLLGVKNDPPNVKHI